eukprot:6773058-Alexandrium_andersonii.AAC.1
MRRARLTTGANTLGRLGQRPGWGHAPMMGPLTGRARPPAGTGSDWLPGTPQTRTQLGARRHFSSADSA